MKHVIAGVVVAGSLAIAGTPAVEAKGCLKGAVVGGVAGHFMHHHTILGAAAGCIIGHHMAHEKEKQEKEAAAAKAKQQPAAQHP